jgi:transposase
MTLEEQAATLRPDEIIALLVSQHELRQQNAELTRQVEWFKRQLFGRKSERRLREPDAQQLPLAGLLPAEAAPADAPPPPTETVKAYQRRPRFAALEATPEESGLRFDGSVPVEVIEVPNPELAGLSTDDYEVIGEKITYRLAQRPGAYVILQYVRKVIKRTATEELSCPPAPPAVLEKSFADVSILAGLLLDKLRYHLPLYRQHQRLAHAGIRLSRATLTQWVQRTAALLEPIYYALLSSILQSAVLTMDETPIKAGWRVKGKLHTGYFWPVYGDQDEVAFPFAASRAGAVVREALGSFCGVLLTDGYIVYERFAQTVNRLVHAQCWSHARRKFVDAERAEPTLVAQALDQIGTLYEHEALIRQKRLEDEDKLRHRAEFAKPLVDAFFLWLKQTLTTQVLLSSNPFTHAARYALEREQALRVFLEYPNVRSCTSNVRITCQHGQQVAYLRSAAIGRGTRWYTTSRRRRLKTLAKSFLA